MVVKRAIYPKEYDIEFTDEQKSTLREILADLKEVEARRRPSKHVPDICPTCGKDKNPPPWIGHMDTWILSDFGMLGGKIHVLEALLGLGYLVGDHT